MTPKVLWSVFALILFSIFVRTDTSLPTYQRGNKIKDRVVQQTKSLVSLKGSENFKDKIPRFDSKKFKNPTLLSKTSSSVLRTPSLHPSPYILTTEQPTTSSYPSLEDSVSLISVSTFTVNESNENLFSVLSTLAQKKNRWKKYLLRILKCVSPTQPPVSLEAYPTNEPTPEASSNPSALPSVLPSVSSMPSVSSIPSSIPTIPDVGFFDFSWKIYTDDIEKVFETEAQIEQSLKTFLNHLLRCKNALIRDVKLLRDQEGQEGKEDQEGLFVKGICYGFRKSCIINLSDDICNDNSLIDDYVAERMLEISSSFDYEIDLSVSFDFDEENINLVPDFLSELIEGASRTQRAMFNSGRPPPPEVNNEANLAIKKDGSNSNFQNEITFKQNTKKIKGAISLSTELPLVELIQFDETISKSSYFSPKNKCGNECLEEKKVLETIFTYYDVNFDSTIDVCFWDDINCIAGSVTQIFIRKYENQNH